MDYKLIGAVLLVIVALGFLTMSVNDTAKGDNSSLIKPDAAKPAIDFTADEINGPSNRFQLSSSIKSTPVVLSFWASWCQYCPVELEELQKISKKYQGRLQFYGVDASDNVEIIKAFSKKHKLDFPMLSDANQNISRQFEVTSLPTMVIIDTHNKVRYISSGYSPDMGNTLPVLLDNLLSEN